MSKCNIALEQYCNSWLASYVQNLCQDERSFLHVAIVALLILNAPQISHIATVAKATASLTIHSFSDLKLSQCLIWVI